MKILMLSGEALDQFHGGAVHTREVARAFCDLGHEVLLVAPGKLNKDSPFQHMSCEMKLGPVTTNWRLFFQAKTLLNFQPDVIYERHLITGGLGSYLSNRLSVPLVLEVNSPHREEYLYRFPWLKLFRPLLDSLERYQFRYASTVVTTHQNLVPGHFKKKSLIGPWAVRRDDTFHKKELLWPQFKDKKIILVAGSFLAWHGTEQLESILKNLEKGPWVLVLLGGGKRRQEIFQKLKEFFPVHDGGELAPDQMGLAYSQSHVLLAPFSQPLPGKEFYYSPFKILEALSYSLPVVTNDFENLKILLDDQWCGSLIPQNASSVQWAGALNDILSQDRLDWSFGEAYASRHCWKDHAQKIMESCHES